jgi:prolipoprotein diacylglyceryltransferase
VLATIRLDFDPSTTVFGLSIRLETLALAGVVLLVLLMAAVGAGRKGAGAIAADSDTRAALPKLRRDDLILIAFGAVPGAVVGGRLEYVLVHLDYYQANTSAIADPSQGSFGLTLAVVLGTLSGVAVARLLAAPVRRWLGVVAIPVLCGLGLGKLATALGGTGQGDYSTASWATTYVHSGDWGSINPSFPAIPSQMFEGGLVLAAIIIVVVPPALLRLRIRRWGPIARPGLAPRHDWRYLSGWRRYLIALTLWAAARFAVAFTWRDAHVFNSLDAEQVILLVLAGLTVVALLIPIIVRAIGRAWAAMARRRAAGRAARAPRAAAAAEAAETARLAAEAAQTADAGGVAAEAADAGATDGQATDEPAATEAEPAPGADAVGRTAEEARATWFAAEAEADAEAKTQLKAQTA